jgi:AcrR family transcriptional regulator
MKRDRGTRDAILAACDRLFYGEGLRAVSVSDVAAAANVTKPTVYYHFASKDLMIEAWLEQRTAKARADTQAITGAPQERLAKAFGVLELQVAHPLFRGCPFVNAVAELADPDHPAILVARTYKTDRLAWFAEIVREAGKPASTAGLLMTLWEGAIARAVIMRDPTVVREAAEAARTAIGGKVVGSGKK